MRLDGVHHANEPTIYDETAFDDFFGTPWLTGIVFFASVVGVFVGAWTLILLVGQLHDGVSAWWPLILIIVLDVALNVALRIVRARKRRARGLVEPRPGRH
jgi:hypothetical protein